MEPTTSVRTFSRAAVVYRLYISWKSTLGTYVYRAARGNGVRDIYSDLSELLPTSRERLCTRFNGHDERSGVCANYTTTGLYHFQSQHR